MEHTALQKMQPFWARFPGATSKLGVERGSQSPYVSIQSCHTWCYCNPLFYPDTFLWLAPKNQELTSMTNNKGLYIIPNLAFYKMLNNPPPNRGHWTSPSKMHPSLISMWCLFFLKVHRKSLAFTSKVRDSRVITIQKSDPGALCKASKTCASCPSRGAILPIL